MPARRTLHVSVEAREAREDLRDHAPTPYVRERAAALAEHWEAPAGQGRRVLGARASRPPARRRRAHLEQTLLICAPEARAPI